MPDCLIRVAEGEKKSSPRPRLKRMFRKCAATEMTTPAFAAVLRTDRQPLLGVCGSVRRTELFGLLQTELW